MRFTRHRYRPFCIVSFTVAVLAQAVPPVLAEDVYPPGWNVRNESVGPTLYDFKIGRTGCWGDYRRYWPEQQSCMEGVPSRPISSGAPIYQFRAEGQRYHPVE